MAQIRKKFGTEQEVYHRSKGQLFGGMFFLVLVIVLDVFLVRIIYVSMTDVDAIPVRKIQVEGDLSTLTKKDIEEFFLKNPSNHNLLTMDLLDVRDYMLQMPWLYKVTLRKKLPDILFMFVIEHKAIAYYNEGILTTDGKVIYPDLSNYNVKMVRLIGPEKIENELKAKQIYDRYLTFKSALDIGGLDIDKVELTLNYMWIITLKNGVILYLGRDIDLLDHNIHNSDVLLERLRKFIESYPYIDNRNLIEYIDLRYDTGMAVKWKTEEPVNDDPKF